MKGVDKMTNDITQGLTEEMENIEVYKQFCDSREKEKILSGKVIGCVPNTDPNVSKPEFKWYAVVECGGWRVIIPGALMGFDVDNRRDKAGNEISAFKKANMYKSFISQMFGANIDFIVYDSASSINANAQMVIGNRAAAMAKERQSNYFKSDKDKKSRMERSFDADEAVIAKVVSICDSVVWVDVFGQTFKVIAREVSWRYTENLHDALHVGDQIHVKFLELNIDKENKTIEGEVSIKAAYPNTMKENMKKYKEGSILLGKVSGIRGDGYFVQVGDHINGIDVYCKKINCLDLPQIGDSVSVKLFSFDYDRGRVFGSIEGVVAHKRINLAA